MWLYLWDTIPSPNNAHYSDATWATWRLKPPATRRWFVDANNKRMFKALVDSSHKGPVMRKGIFMTSWCICKEASCRLYQRWRKSHTPLHVTGTRIREFNDPCWRHVPSKNLTRVTPSHYHIEAETKWTPFSRRHFEVHFLEWKCLNSDWKFIEFCS